MPLSIPPTHLGTFQTAHSGFSPFGTGAFSNSITTVDNSLLVVELWCTLETTNTALWDADLAVSGGGLTFTRETNQRAVSGSNIGGVQQWTALVTTGATFNLTVDAGANSAYTYKVVAHSYTGHDTADPVGATAVGTEDPMSGAVSITLSAAPNAASDVIAIVGMFSGDTDITPGSGWTQLVEPTNIPDSFAEMMIQDRTGSTSTTVAWTDVTSTFPGPGHAAAIEIKAAAGETLDAAAGSFTLTGQAATFLVNRVLAAAGGVFTLTGAAAGLSPGKRLVAASGAFALTGFEAALRKTGNATNRVNAEKTRDWPTPARAEPQPLYLWALEIVKLLRLGEIVSRGLSISEEQALSGAGPFDFIGIPASARRVILMMNQLSLSGTDNLLVQLGDAGGVLTSGYESTSVFGGGASSQVNSTSGFIVQSADAARSITGHMVLTRMGTGIWIASHTMKAATTLSLNGGGSKVMTTDLDRLRIAATGSNTLDAGSAAVLWD